MPNLKYLIINGSSKQCADCLAFLPLTQFRKARNHLTTRCIECLRKYAAAYRQRPEVKAAQLAYSREYRSKETNRLRLNEKIRLWRKQPHAKQNRNAARRAWAAREKEKAIAYKGGKCAACGYSACPAALDFHHTDPTQKDGYGTGALKQHWTFERNKKEIDKCTLLCVRCHREIHSGFRKL